MDEVVKKPVIESKALNRLKGGDQTLWPNITKAEQLSREKMAELKQIAGSLVPEGEGSFVVFGSLARDEFTVDSDLDWAIIIDGCADSDHLKYIHSLRADLSKAGFNSPGSTGLFGGLVFSHELIHAIGGDEDTNKNMTRRLLLLLESATIDHPGSKQVHDRVIMGILNRYVQEDANFISANTGKDKIPRFLLNDVVRFWRTMAVDYVNKFRARAGDGWALKNIKLRMSRKLLFVSGLFMCISWALRDQRNESEDEAHVAQALVRHLFNWTRKPPLESLAEIVQSYNPSLANKIFDSYDTFLHLLNDEKKRSILESVAPDQAYQDDVFLAARRVAHTFDAALLELMFESNKEVTRLVKKYGVF